ncbi:MAG: bifunctional methylenetetrahydrofolate dehydrogenase/methenyltetrahydrofolate cyclohydrolase [Bacilli bacterium]|nr:bifunctional methylenetetrahydrofolate dehydrogenase/methenyltetrahydrofolate cyclohydrolase [Bacilli bacterium]
MRKNLNGKEVSAYLRSEIKKEVEKLKTKPKMVDIQIGHNPASDIYIAGKEKASNEVGIKFECLRYDENEDQENIINKIKEMNNDPEINGIFIQSPVPDKFDEIKLMNTVIPEKDVDGLTYLNAGKLLNNIEAMVSCTPNGIIKMLDYYKIDIEGKNVVIVGRSNLVGKPLMNLFLNRNATVTVCHSKTSDLKMHTKKADILVAAVGKKHLITKEMVKKGAVVIDVGINRIDGKIYGDVDYDNVYEKVKYITPVPGGVGPMTVTMLLYNVLDGYKKQNKI